MSVCKSESGDQSQESKKRDDVDLQRVKDLLDLHHDLKVSGQQAVERSLHKARMQVDEVLKDLENKKES